MIVMTHLEALIYAGLFVLTGVLVARSHEVAEFLLRLLDPPPPHRPLRALERVVMCERKGSKCQTRR